MGHGEKTAPPHLTPGFLAVSTAARRTWTRSKPQNNMVRAAIVGTLFRTMELLAFTDSEAWSIPLECMVELGMCVEI